MKTEWDYTELAQAYVERPPYADDALQKLFSIAGMRQGDTVCDIGAGVGHLTIPLAANGYTVFAVEPNDAMRTLGAERTKRFPAVQWIEATGTDTKQQANMFDLVTFGSSFNVMDRQAALKETYRLLKPHKYFICLWNHRNIDDPVQHEIEAIIRRFIPDYDYGSRREDQTAVIEQSQLFSDIQEITGSVLHTQSVDDMVEAWRSHATLHRQAQDKFPAIICEIERYLNVRNEDTVVIPYTTRAWIARRKG